MGIISIKLSPDERFQSIKLAFNRLIRSYTLYFWVTRVRPMLSEHPRATAEHFALTNVEHSCIENVLMIVRDLDDFFAPATGKKFPTDMRAADVFDFKTPGRFLTSSDRNAINERIAHLTYVPVHSKTTGVSPDSHYYWNTSDQVKKATLAMISFMDHLLALPPTQISNNEIDEVKVWKKAVLQLLKNMENRATLENNAQNPRRKSQQ